MPLPIVAAMRALTLRAASILVLSSVLGLLSGVACGCARTPAPAAPGAPRDELRGALYASEWGLQKVLDECHEQVTAIAQHGRVPQAYWLADVCGKRMDAARDGFLGAMVELGAFDGAASVQKIGCAMIPTVKAFHDLLPALRTGGFMSDEADDAMARAEWLVRACRSAR